MSSIREILAAAKDREVYVATDGAITISPSALQSILQDTPVETLVSALQELPRFQSLISELMISHLDSELACKALAECEAAFCNSEEIAQEIFEATSEHLHSWFSALIIQEQKKLDPFQPIIAGLESLGFFVSKHLGFVLGVKLADQPLVVLVRKASQFDSWKLSILPAPENFETMCVSERSLLDKVKATAKENEHERP